ncbi:unnamed protein product [Closterium sp. NIES-64]|nr:unnamed protein product [Closterium sp. NIES-64]
MSLFSVPIGTWVDLCPRLPLAAFAISAQNAALFLAAIAVAALLYLADFLAAPAAASSAGPDLFAWVTGAAETGADVALVAAVCVLGAAAALAGLARGIAVERDWAVVIADWVCEQEASPARHELLPVSLPLAMAVWVLVAAAAELLLLALVHSQVPALGERRKERAGEGMVEDERAGERERESEGGEEEEVEEEEDEEAEEEEEEEQGRGRGVGRGGDDKNGALDVKSRVKAQGDNGKEHEGGDGQILVPSAANPTPPAPITPSDSPAAPIITTTTTTRSSSSSEPPLIPSTAHNPSFLNHLLSSLHHLRLLLTSWLTTLRSAWTVYLRQTSLFPSLALALLYLTVLSFGSLMCAYLHSQGVPLGLLGSASGAAAVTGVLGATLFPSLCARLGPSRTAEASVWSQLACLLPCVVAGLVLQSSGPIPAVLLMAGVVLSRAPLWVFDLSVLQMVQGAVVEEERGAVGGVQESLQQGMQLVALVLAAVISRPRDFWVLTTVSGGAVMLAAVLVSVDRRLRGILRRIRRGGWQRQAEGLMGVDGRAGSGAGADEV